MPSNLALLTPLGQRRLSRRLIISSHTGTDSSGEPLFSCLVATFYWLLYFTSLSDKYLFNSSTRFDRVSLEYSSANSWGHYTLSEALAVSINTTTQCFLSTFTESNTYWFFIASLLTFPFWIHIHTDFNVTFPEYVRISFPPLFFLVPCPNHTAALWALMI